MGAADRVALEPAWVLHHYPYRDSSLLLEVFTPGYGRMGLVARGARSPRGQWHSLLQILQPLLLSWTARGELGTLTGAERRSVAGVLGGRQVLCACYLNELLLRLLRRHDPHPGLFHAYENAITGLAGDEEQALRCFEKHLLQELGYGLLLDQEADSGVPVAADALYEYRLERGPVRCRQPATDGIYLHGASLLALHDERLDGQRVQREVKALMRAALGLYLGERPLKTRSVLQQLASLSGREALSARACGAGSENKLSGSD